MADVSSRLSTQERDRRYALLREGLRERGVGCAVVASSNVFYLTNGLPGERHAILPTKNEPLMVAMHDRNVVDLPPEGLAEIQRWVQDVRPGNDASPLVDRIRELRLDNGVIGLTSSTIGYGGMSHGICSRLQAAFPSARFVDVSDVFAAARAIKSEEEIALIERANQIFETGAEAVRAHVRPGMLGVRAIHEGTRAMWDAGGDLSSTLGISCWPVPKRNHVLQQISLDRTIEPGDVAILTGWAKYGGYTGHSDQVLCFGPSKALHRDMLEAVRFVRDAMLREVKPGATQHQLAGAYQSACRETAFLPSTQTQIHQYGIDGTEHPGRAFAVAGTKGDFVLVSWMVYSIAPAVQVSAGEDTIIGGTTVVVTREGYRELGGGRLELLSTAT